MTDNTADDQKSQTQTKTDDIERLMAAIGQAQLSAGYPVNEVNDTLARISQAYERPQLTGYVLPNAVFVDDERTGRARVLTSDIGSMRLDQATQVHRVVRDSIARHLNPVEAIAKLAAVQDMKARFPQWAVVLANGLAAAGFALVFRVSLWGVLIAGILGALVGLALTLTANRPTLAALVPFTSAFVAAFVVFTASAYFDAEVQPVRVVAAPIITLIPGVGLTRGTQELANNQIVSGSSRLISASVQILVLTFGILTGARLAPLQDYNFADLTDALLPWWAAWIGVLVFAIGQSIVSNEPRGAVRIVVVLLLATYGVQTLVSATIDPILASGVAAGAALLGATVVQRRSRRGFPAFALFEPVFWLLVPGSLGLVALTQEFAARDAALTQQVDAAGNNASSVIGLTTGTDVLTVAAGTIIAITIGMLVASAMARLVPTREAATSTKSRSG
ncbi:MAG: threonine/serine ThrE exporter family protein, partial [Candidatus Nanopelagicales bacterium]